ncbi:MAG TPA: YlxR family protein [Polyangia bacterium]|nr:YlxR family protein [Polyangia bacterium]
MESLRTCVGCRRRGPAGDMLRLVIESGTVTIAGRRKRSGRGASVHRDPACLESARQPGVLARAFKRPVELAVEAALTFSQLSATSRK